MKLFISLAISNPKDVLMQQGLISELRKLHISVFTAADLKKNGLSGRGFEDFDALILDGGVQDADTGYFLAIALAHKKPVLYLRKKGELLDHSVDALARNKEVKKYIKIHFYAPDTLVGKIKAFLQYLDQSIGRELYTIKYTLRLSPRMDRYVRWKAGQAKKNKADFLRDWVDEHVKQDEEYKTRLQ